MKFEHYLKRAEESKEYKKFKQEHGKAYLCAGFFVLDFETGKHTHQVDYFIPNSKKIATFVLDEGVDMKISEEMKMKTKLEKMEEEVKIDLDALKGIVEDEMHNRTITQQVKKIIAVLQKQDGKYVWKLNCITDGMGIIKVHVNDDTSNILEFEKINLFDIMRMIPKGADLKLPGKQDNKAQ